MALLASNAHAEPPSDELIRTYLVETGMRAAYESILTSIPNQVATISGPFLDSFGEMLRQQGYGEPQVTSAMAYINGFMERFAKDTAAELGKTVSWEIIEAQVYFPILREHLTTEEMAAAVAFNQSPVGRSLRDKLPRVGAQSQQRMTEIMAPLTQNLPQRIHRAAQQELPPRWREALGPPAGAPAAASPE